MPHDPRRRERVVRYQPNPDGETASPVEHINAIGMVLSLVGLLLKVRQHGTVASGRGF